MPSSKRRDYYRLPHDWKRWFLLTCCIVGFIIGLAVGSSR